MSLNYMARKLNSLEEDQKKFIGNVSHDFRSPLTSIKGYVEAMKDGTIPPEMQGKYLDIVLFETEDKEIRLNVPIEENETVWLTQAQMTELFNVDRSVITRHVNNVFKDNELKRESNVQKMHIANSDKPVQFYSLEVII